MSPLLKAHYVHFLLIGDTQDFWWPTNTLDLPTVWILFDSSQLVTNLWESSLRQWKYSAQNSPLGLASIEELCPNQSLWKRWPSVHFPTPDSFAVGSSALQRTRCFFPPTSFNSSLWGLFIYHLWGHADFCFTQQAIIHYCPFLFRGSNCPTVDQWELTPVSFRHDLIVLSASWNKIFQAFLGWDGVHLLWPTPGITSFPKEPWILLMGVVFGS